MVLLYSLTVQILLYLDFYNTNVVYILIYVLENDHSLISRTLRFYKCRSTFDMKLIVSSYKGHLRSSGNSVVFPKRGKKLSKSIYTYIQNHQYQWIHRMLHVQDIGEFGPCYDSGRNSKAKRCDFRLERFSSI